MKYSSDEHLPKDEYKKKVCKSKRSFKTKRLAKEFAKKWMKIGTKGSKRKYPYECPICGEWHLTKYKNYGEVKDELL